MSASPSPGQWDAFISHASEDKDDIARPLAEELVKRGFKIWYDEFELEVGDSLRTRIDHGLANSQHGIVVLSPHFFEKSWPQSELDGLVALGDENRRILPVWHNLGKEEVTEHSPMLAGLRAAKTHQTIADLADELISAMSKAGTSPPDEAAPRRQLSLSPPPSQVELRMLPSGGALINAIVGQHEGQYDFDSIPDPTLRSETAESVQEIRDLAEIWDDLSLQDRERAKERATELVLEMLDKQLIPQVGHYERRLTGEDGEASPWRGVVVRIAPGEVIAKAQQEGQPTSASPEDQAQLDELLALLTRSAMQRLGYENFVDPWPANVKTPLQFLVNEFNEVEHEFNDLVMEEKRQRLIQAANHFLYQETKNGFVNRMDPMLRDAGFPAAEAEGDPKIERLLDRRHEALLAASQDVQGAYDDLVKAAKRAGYSLDALKGGPHPMVIEHDQRLGLL